jgi:hypothetical protein
MRDFVLTGENIEIHYRTHDDKLSVQGAGLPLGEGEFTFSGEEITRSESADGHVFSVVLLLSSRAGMQIRMNVIFPEVLKSTEDQDITGAAIIVSDWRTVVTHVSVLQNYDVRPLSGTSYAS